MNNDIRNLTKWLNEEQETPIDRQALARVLAMAEQPAQQEPVAWMNPNGGMLTANYIDNFASGLDKEIHSIPLYTSPPASKPLTKQERDLIHAATGSMTFFKAVEHAISQTEEFHNIKAST